MTNKDIDDLQKLHPLVGRLVTVKTDNNRRGRFIYVVVSQDHGDFWVLSVDCVTRCFYKLEDLELVEPDRIDVHTTITVRPT